MNAPAIRTLPPANNGLRVLIWAGITTGFAMAAVALAAGEPVAAVVAAVAVPAAVFVTRPDAAVIAVLFIMFTNANVIAVKFHGVPFVVAAAVPLLLVVPLWRELMRKGERLVLTPVVPLLIAFILVEFVGAALSIKPGIAMENVVNTVIEGLILYVLVVNAVRTRATLRRAIWALLVAGVLLGSLTIHQHVTGRYSSTYYGFAQVKAAEQVRGEEELLNERARHSGAIGEPNRYAQVMGMLLPLALTVYLTRRSRMHGVLALGAFLIVGIATGLTLSRGVTVGLGLTLLAAAALGYVRVRYVVACVAVIALVALAVPRYGTRVASLVNVASFVKDGATAGVEVDGSVRGRANEMLAAAMMFAEHPLIGVGPGMYPLHYQSYARRVGGKARLDEQRRSHSLYLDLASEQGLMGLLLFLAMVGVTLHELRQARERWVDEHPVAAHMAMGFFLALVVYLTTGLFLHNAYARYMWMFMALSAAASRIPPDEEPATS